MAESTFRNSIQSSVRGLWSGVLSKSQFNSAMKSALHRHLTIAWLEGAKECGIESDELSEDESKARDSFIDEQGSYVSDFGDRIKEVNKKAGGKLQPLFGRAEQWIHRYSEAKANGHAMACADEKAEFELGPTSDHCRTCKGLNGKVFRNSTWIANNAVPPHNWNFACKGGCQCRLKQTKKPLTRGRFPVGLLG